MLRYIWKERFDDRTFWAAVLSVVAKGLATFDTGNGAVALRPTEKLSEAAALPPEEELIARQLRRSGGHRRVAFSMLDGNTTAVVTAMAFKLRQAAAGKWFRENRGYAIFGVALSAIAVGLTARPRYQDEWMALVLGLVVMAPAAYYLLFLVLRIRDLLRVLRERPDRTVLWHLAPLLAFSGACLSGILLGSVVLTANFGWATIAATVLLAAVTLTFTQLIMAPTQEGRKLLDQIEGFRLFLQTVERWPTNREDPPAQHAGLYEKYLPYAVALDLEQYWSDKLLAVASTAQKAYPMLGAESFYLGMWNGKPVEIAFKPEVRK